MGQGPVKGEIMEGLEKVEYYRYTRSGLVIQQERPAETVYRRSNKGVGLTFITILDIRVHGCRDSNEQQEPDGQRERGDERAGVLSDRSDPGRFSK
jgi:hypothetical protein